MKEQTAVTKDGKEFGSAQISTEGLYYRIYVRCAEPVRVWIKGRKLQRDLGLCVPGDGGFTINTRIPVKHLGEGPFFFWVAERNEKAFPVYPDKPFKHLEKLRGAMLFRTDGMIGIQIERTKPTGQ